LSITQAMIEAGTPIVNTATATGHPSVGPDVTDTATATVTMTQGPAIDVTKLASPTSFSAPGTVTYSYTVKNIGNVTLNPVSLVDDKAGVVTLAATSLVPGASTTGTKTYAITQAMIDAGTPIVNTATATGHPSVGPDVTATATATVTVTQTPAVTLAKTVSPNNVSVPGNVTYSYTVTNTGNVTLTGLVLTDDKAGPITLVATTLAPGASTTGTATFAITQAMIDAGTPIVNTAKVTSTQGVTATATATVTITRPISLATRTLGFWQTHTAFTSAVFTRFFPSGMNIGVGSHKGVITNVQQPGKSQLFGAFYAGIPKTTAGSPRSALDKARIQMLQQLVAAKLNAAAFGTSPSNLALISAADAACGGTDAALILSLAGKLDSYNNSGDAVPMPAGLPAQGSATPKTSQSYADLAFWNLP
ncbi:MAG: hypothetical protein Q7T05_06595, partial [Dehalococcoidia bacterium]|nr:hypothetical protein [Dehalococcoidia bacterium]